MERTGAPGAKPTCSSNSLTLPRFSQVRWTFDPITEAAGVDGDDGASSRTISPHGKARDGGDAGSDKSSVPRLLPSMQRRSGSFHRNALLQIGEPVQHDVDGGLTLAIVGIRPRL